MADPALRSLCTLDELAPSARHAPRWSLDEMRGRFVELSARGAAATLTAALDLVLDAQTQDEPAVWVMLPSSTFFPQDASDSGIDLAALAMIRACDAMTAARTAERLVRSGAFGVVIVDLGDLGNDEHGAEISLAIQGRLVALAQTHDAAIACLTDKSDAATSLGSLVSLRAGVLRDRERDGFAMAVHALKDKRRGPGWTHVATRRGPTGWT